MGIFHTHKTTNVCKKNAYTYREDQRDWERLGEIERDSEIRLGFKRGY